MIPEPEDETAVRLRDAVMAVAFYAGTKIERRAFQDPSLKQLEDDLDAYRDYCEQRGRVAALEEIGCDWPRIYPELIACRDRDDFPECTNCAPCMRVADERQKLAAMRTKGAK